MHEQELTLFGGWAKARIPRPIVYGLDRHSAIPSLSISIDTHPLAISAQAEYAPVIYHGVLYENVAHARWAAFFEAVGSPFVYRRVSFEFHEQHQVPVFWIRFSSHCIAITDTQPRGGEISKLVALVTQSSYLGMLVLHGQVWSKDLSHYKGMAIKRNLGVYASEGPDSDVITSPLPLSGFHIYSLAYSYFLHLWIIQGKVYLYSDGMIAHYAKSANLIEKVLLKNGKEIEKERPRLNALLKYLPLLEHTLPQELRIGSHFLTTQDAFTVTTTQHWRDCGLLHTSLLDDFLVHGAHTNPAKILNAYQAAFRVAL